MDQPNQPSPPAGPSQPTTPSPGPAAAASSRASEPASATSSGPGFIADNGPVFDPERAAAAAPPAAEPEAPAPIEWEEDTVKSILLLKGRALHAGIGVADQDWRYTELDLAAIAPPLTRIANRYEPVQRLAKHADPLILLFAFGGYGVRSLEERAAALRELAAGDVETIEPLDEVEELAVPINASPQAPAPTPTAVPQQYAPSAPAGPPQEAQVDAGDLQWKTGAPA